MVFLIQIKSAAFSWRHNYSATVEDRAGAKSSRLIKIDLLLTLCKKKDLVISAFIPFHTFNDTLLSFMSLFFVSDGAIICCSIRTQRPFNSLSSGSCARCLHAFCSHQGQKKKTDKERERGRERRTWEIIRSQHLKCYITSSTYSAQHAALMH